MSNLYLVSDGHTGEGFLVKAKRGDQAVNALIANRFSPCLVTAAEAFDLGARGMQVIDANNPIPSVPTNAPSPGPEGTAEAASDPAASTSAAGATGQGEEDARVSGASSPATDADAPPPSLTGTGEQEEGGEPDIPTFLRNQPDAAEPVVPGDTEQEGGEVTGPEPSSDAPLKTVFERMSDQARADAEQGADTRPLFERQRDAMQAAGNGNG